LYTSHGLSPAQYDLPSCALLLSACLRHLKSTDPAGKADTQVLVDALVHALKRGLKKTPPMPESRDVRDKTVRRWLKGVTRDVNEFLRGTETPRDWLESWMVRSRFIPSASA
jgi:hypothetical protein